jgi:hypothetical protein
MSTLIYVSRNYTEFGPFTPAEILDFNKRGILHGSDHLRPHGGDLWAPLEEWLSKSEITAVKPVAAAKDKAAPTAKKTAAKKAARKTAKKAAKSATE